jgi:hypothetical protein
MGSVRLPQKNEVKYLGMHLGRRLTWAKHIKPRRKQLNLKAKQMHWLLGTRSTLSTESKLLLYKAVLKPIWNNGMDSLQFQNQNSTALSIQDSPIHTECTLGT